MGWDDALFSNRRRASSFGDDAEQYDRIRPPYPDTLVDVLVAENPRTVLDVGCGTGIAARLLHSRGCDVVGLEPDPRMAVVARGHGITVEEGMFEAWDAGERRFDLLISGQAWHWVNPHVGAIKAATLLHPGARIGLFWNQSFPGPEARQAMDAVYARCAPELGENSVLIGQRDSSLYEAIAQALRDTEQFDDISLQLFGHDIDYRTEEWLELVTTHSDHRTLPPEELRTLLSELRVAIDGVGGHVPVHYETTLVTGRTVSH